MAIKPYSGEVVLIPWAHDIDDLQHSEVIQFIQSLPKNSLLALEATTDFLNTYHKIRQSWIDKNPLPNNSQDVAFMEVIHEAQKRNIKIIPIESPAAIRSWRPKTEQEKIEELFGWDDARELKRSELREKQFCQHLIDTLEQAENRKVYTIIGIGHCVSTYLQLRKKNIKSRIEFERFKAFDLRAAFRINEKYREAVKQGDLDTARKMIKKMEPFHKEIKSQEKGDEKTHQLYLDIIKVIKAREDRWKRKLEKRKRRLAQRRRPKS